MSKNIFYNLFRKRPNEITKKVMDYFKIENTENGTLLLGDFVDRDFCSWLKFIHDGIQKAMNEKLIDGKKIENYANITFYLAGQRVDISIIKDGCKSPHELLNEFFHMASRMRYLQGSGGWGRPNSEIKAAEKQVDDFLEKNSKIT